MLIFGGAHVSCPDITRACLAAFSQDTNLELHNRNVQFSLPKTSSCGPSTKIAEVDQLLSKSVTLPQPNTIVSVNAPPPACVAPLVQDHGDSGGELNCFNINAAVRVRSCKAVIAYFPNNTNNVIFGKR